MRLRLWIGHNAIRTVIAVQFGTAMMPLCSLMRLALISGITSGTFGSMRKADELSMTTAPVFTAMGENFREMPPPAENSAISTPSKEGALRSSIGLPAERALASALSWPTRNPRLSMVAMNSAPTAPVTPAMATTGSFFTLLYPLGLSMISAQTRCAFVAREKRYPLFRIMPQAIKKPRTFSGGASVQMMRSSGYARTPPEGPGGFGVLGVGFGVVVMRGRLRGRGWSASTAFA